MQVRHPHGREHSVVLLLSGTSPNGDLSVQGKVQSRQHDEEELPLPVRHETIGLCHERKALEERLRGERESEERSEGRSDGRSKERDKLSAAITKTHENIPSRRILPP